MTDHDWQPIAPPEDNGIMCTVCFECKCCSDWTDECPGDWVPSEEDFNSRLWLDQTKDRVQYADPEEVRKVAERIVSENQELMRRLS